MYGYKKACSNIAKSYIKVWDESMSAIRFCTTSKGNLPHFSYILNNPEPIGTEFKTVACSITGDLIFLETQQYHLELGATAACTKILMGETKGLGQRAMKGLTRGCLLFNS